MKHTQGPWAWVKVDGHENRQGWLNANGYAVLYAPDREGGDIAIRDADARLIAEAPAMLEALRDAIEQIEGIGIEDWAGAEGLDFSQIRAIIERIES